MAHAPSADWIKTNNKRQAHGSKTKGAKVSIFLLHDCIVWIEAFVFFSKQNGSLWWVVDSDQHPLVLSLFRIMSKNAIQVFLRTWSTEPSNQHSHFFLPVVFNQDQYNKGWLLVSMWEGFCFHLQESKNPTCYYRFCQLIFCTTGYNPAVAQMVSSTSMRNLNGCAWWI